MSALNTSDTHCMGQLPGPPGGTTPCSRRDNCARYTQRANRSEAAPLSQWMCPGKDSYWPHYVQVAA
ncbi:MAG: hypothetical protein V4718_00630 [Pseudomonadota bacterium]